MKRFLILFTLLSLSAGALADKPVQKGSMICRTKQQDAELRQWIIGIQNEAAQAIAKTKEAEKSQGEVATKLDGVSKKADELQLQIDGLKKERDDAVAHDAKVTKKYHFLKIGACAILAGFVFLLLSKLKLASIVPFPYNLVIKFGGPAIVFTIFWFIL